MSRLAAVAAGFVSLAVLSLTTDAALHFLNIYPPLSIALAYRLVYVIAGGYIAARFAPFAPIHHAVILGMVAFTASAADAIVTILLSLDPAWALIALMLTAMPAAALGGVLYCKRNRDHRERSALTTPLLFPYTFRLPECDDFRALDSAAPSSSASARLVQSKSPFQGS